MKFAALSLGMSVVGFCASSTLGSVIGQRFDTPVTVSDGMQIDLDGDGIVEVTLTKRTATNPDSFPEIAFFFMNGFILGEHTETWSAREIPSGAGGTVYPVTRSISNSEVIDSDLDWDVYPSYFNSDYIAAEPDGALMFSAINQTKDYGAEWAFDDAPRYVPLRWTRDDAIHYGWIELVTKEVGSREEAVEHAFFYLGYAYETEPGVGLIAGEVPEPATLGLFTLSGLALMRTR